ncbi:hypothetical protein MRB53_012341 [Persea americana]|uniref:Uncharacterized protein n=1 Tax=Persea americana TaxID=3435 RepID=A0ACC2LXP0_PERAE|nr:hypothetical protein MRB53_012341 [Persea americana]
MTSVLVEEERVSDATVGAPGRDSINTGGSFIANIGSSYEEDNDRCYFKFQNSSSDDEFELIFQGQSNKLGRSWDSSYLDYRLNLVLLANNSPRVLCSSEKPTPNVSISYSSSPNVALSEWEEVSGGLQIIPSFISDPMTNYNFNTPINSSGHVAHHICCPGCSSEFKKSSEVLSPIKRLVLYSSNSDDYYSPMKEPYAYECDTDPTPIPVDEWDSHVIEDLLSATACGVLTEGLRLSPLPLLERQVAKWVAWQVLVIKQGIKGGWKKAIGVPKMASSCFLVSCDRASTNPEMDQMDRA